MFYEVEKFLSFIHEAFPETFDKFKDLNLFNGNIPKLD